VVKKKRKKEAGALSLMSTESTTRSEDTSVRWLRVLLCVGGDLRDRRERSVDFENAGKSWG
jgi:hypothetical protein